MINTNEITPGYHAGRNSTNKVSWKTPGLKITRVRMISDRLHHSWDISYVHGTVDGQDVDVRLPFSQVPKLNNQYRNSVDFGFIINAAKRDGVYAKGLGFFDALSLTSD